MKEVCDKEDLRGEWYNGYSPWAAFVPTPPRIFRLGLALTAIWLPVYLLIYPSIPFPPEQTHWKGLGVPGGCQPWTAICELQQAEVKLQEVRGKYLAKLHARSAAELADDIDMWDFIARLGRVPFEEQCAGCHGKGGAGVAIEPPLAPVLNDAIWLHGAGIPEIQDSIRSSSIHPFGLNRRMDDTGSKMLAIYVRNLSGDTKMSLDW